MVVFYDAIDQIVKTAPFNNSERFLTQNSVE